MSEDYSMEELLPIVAELTAKYTRYESSSVTYEKAEQLMGAVLYCIREYETSNGNQSNSYTNASVRNELYKTQKMSAKEIYQIGYQKVLQKVEDSRLFYNEMIVRFHAYGNENYQDTVEKGIPGFFKWYDPKFAPQDSIISMDYPTICRIDASSGIDAIAQYLQYIALEQKFLGSLSEEYVIEALTAYQADYRWQFDNICSIVLQDILVRTMKVDVFSHHAEPEKQLIEQLKKLIYDRYEDNQALFHYLKADIKDICTRLNVMWN